MLRGTGFSGRLRRGAYFFTYGLPVASSRCLAIVRKRPLVSVRCSVPLCASAIRATDAAGESSASWLSTAERRGGRRSQPRWLSPAASVRRGWVAVPASSWRLGHTNKFDGARLLRRFGLTATRTISPTVKWEGLTLRPLGRAGRSLPQRRPATPIAGAIGASPAGCDPLQRIVRLIGSCSSGRTSRSGCKFFSGQIREGTGARHAPVLRKNAENEKTSESC